MDEEVVSFLPSRCAQRCAHIDQSVMEVHAASTRWLAVFVAVIEADRRRLAASETAARDGSSRARSGHRNALSWKVGSVAGSISVVGHVDGVSGVRTIFLGATSDLVLGIRIDWPANLRVDQAGVENKGQQWVALH